MKRILFIFSFVLFALAAGAEEINWETSYDKALSRAEQENRNIFILITAPSWCVPCQQLEAGVFPNPVVISLINENYVALYVEDAVNGKPNPELNSFQFTGFPTMFVYNTKKEKLAEIVGAVPADHLINQLVRYTDPDFDISSTFSHIVFSDASLDQIALKEWVFTQGTIKISMPEVARNATHAVLYNAVENFHVLVPLNPGDSQLYLSRDRGASWQTWKKALDRPFR